MSFWFIALFDISSFLCPIFPLIWLPWWTEHPPRHHLAPISGSIDKTDRSPLAAAWRELNEETTLTAASLTLLRQGKSYSFSDESVGREWTIYPFAFRLKTADEGGGGEQAIQTDWEHEDWGWHDPLAVEDSDEFGGVPRLAESLRRVWFEKGLGETAGGILSDGLERLRTDHESGARELAGVALQILRDVVAELDPAEDQPLSEWWAKVRFAAWHIWKNGRESMGAAIMSVLAAALSSIGDTLREHEEFPGSTHSMKWRDAVVEGLERRIDLRRVESSKAVSRAFAKNLETEFSARLTSGKPLSILTLSESSTVAHSLRHLVFESGFSLDVRVLESRPLYEGVSLAASLAQDIISTRTGTAQQANDSQTSSALPKARISVYTDASAAIAAEGVDLVVAGADKIASKGAVSNKTGSLPAILSAKHVANARGTVVKVVVLGELEKVAPPEQLGEDIVEDNDPQQVVRSWKAEYNSSRVKRGGEALDGALGKETGRTGGSGTEDGGEAVEVAIHNIFFEWTPAGLIDVYMTEFGERTAQEIAQHSERLGAEWDKLCLEL